MNPKKVITITFLTAFLVIGIVLIFGLLISGNQKPFNKIDCAKAGEESSNSSLGPKNNPRECCKGLVEISAGLKYEPDKEYADENGCVHIMEGSGNICSDCGNGICESWENRCNCSEDCKKKQVTITTDKTEYEQGETVKITVRNNLDNPIKHLKGVGCGLQSFYNGEWNNSSRKSCRWDGEDELKPNSEYNFDLIAYLTAPEPRRHRAAFYYKEQELIETKEKTIGKIICKGEDIPDELKELLLNGKWINNDVDPGAMCRACGCFGTAEDAWSVDGAVIDVTYVSCAGNSYTIKYKGEEYNCVSENYKPLYEEASLYPKAPEGWETIYSNEFTIKEKSALDPRCSEKAKFSGNCEVVVSGFEFDLNRGKCVIKDGNCSVETPFNSLEECQEVCEKKDMSCKQGVDCIEKCPKCIDNPPLSTGCASQPRCVNEICKCICNCLPSNLLPH